MFGFDKNVNTHRWDANLLYITQFSDFEINLDEKFKSTLIKTNQKLIRDEQSLDLNGKYKISDNTRTAIIVSSHTISDNQSVGINKVSSHAFYGGIEYRPSVYFILEPYIGFRFDRQINEDDEGVSLSIKSYTNNLEISDIKTSFQGYYKRDYLSPRNLENISTNISIQKDFFENTKNTFNASYRKNHKEFYFTADSTTKSHFGVNNNIEKRIENIFSAGDTLDYRIVKGIHLSTNGFVLLRNIARKTRYKPSGSRFFDNNINDFKIEGALQLSFNQIKNLSGNLLFAYSERDIIHTLVEAPDVSMSIFDARKRDEEKKNNYSRRTTLSANLKYDITRSDQLFLSGSSSILRYDTHSLLNDDDRDELWMSYNLSTAHQINSYLNIRTSLDVHLSHIVYILGSRSANNNWNRIFRLSPVVSYQPSKSFSTTNSFEVLGNYTVYDFEKQLLNVRSFSFRQFSFIDSSSISINTKTGLDLLCHIRLYERGELNWSEFKGRPVNYFEDKTIISQIRYGDFNNLLFSVGIRYFTQTRYAFEGRNKYIETHLRSVGPITTVLWNVHSSAQVMIKGWFENINFTETKPRESVNMNMTVNISI